MRELPTAGVEMHLCAGRPGLVECRRHAVLCCSATHLAPSGCVIVQMLGCQREVGMQEGSLGRMYAIARAREPQ